MRAEPLWDATNSATAQGNPPRGDPIQVAADVIVQKRWKH